MEVVAPVSPKLAPNIGHAPPPRLPHTYLDDNNDRNKSSCRGCSSHNTPLRLQLQLPPKQQNPPLHTVSTISSQPLHIQTTRYSSLNWRKKKKKTKGITPDPFTTSDILRLMDGLGFAVPIDIYTSLIEECTVSGSPDTALELLNHITTRSGIKPPLSLLNRLLVMLVSCGLEEYARYLFDKMNVRDFNSWAILIVACFNNEDYEEAVGLFLSMLNQVDMLGLPKWIMVCLLKACAYSMNLDLGKQVHGLLLKLDICDDVLLTSSLIRFYGKFNCSEDANIAFKRVSRHNTFTWTAKIVNDCQEMHFHEVLSDFKEMGRQRVRKNPFTLSSVLKACGRMPRNEQCGQQVHADAIKLGLASDTYVQCGLIDMYGRIGLVRDARFVFEMINDRTNIACWNAMLMGFLQNGMYIEAVKFLYQMKAAGVQPQESLLNEVRIACGGSEVVNYVHS